MDEATDRGFLRGDSEEEDLVVLTETTDAESQRTRNHRGARKFLRVVSTGCQALITCAEQLNTIDPHKTYGTTIARTAKALHQLSEEGGAMGRDPYDAFAKIARAISLTMDVAHAPIYAALFDCGTLIFTYRKDGEEVSAGAWLHFLKYSDDLSAHNMSIELKNEGREFANDELTSGAIDIFHAYSRALKKVEDATMRRLAQYAEPWLHALAVWMRGAYEAIKVEFPALATQED